MVEHDPTYGLVQQRYADEPWKLLVACIMLNQTTAEQARPVLEELFTRYPTPQHVCYARAHELIQLLRPCGLYEQRAGRLVALTTEIVKRQVKGEDWEKRVAELPGVGPYALEAWRMFVDPGRVMAVVAKDAALREYQRHCLFGNPFRPEGW